jgi:hypothetical protein
MLFAKVTRLCQSKLKLINLRQNYFDTLGIVWAGEFFGEGFPERNSCPIHLY